MERPHRELRSRFTDGLCGNDADRLAEVDHMASAKIATIAQDTNPALRLAGQHGADLDPLYTRLVDTLYQFLIDLLVGLDYDITGERILDIFERNSAQNTISEWLNDFSAFHERSDFDTIHGTTIVFANDGVLGHIYEPTGKVTSVGGLESRIRKTLTGTVG